MVKVLLLIEGISLLFIGILGDMNSTLPLFFLVGLCSINITIIISFSATKLKNSNSAGIIGNLMAGVLLGILLSRFISSTIATVFSWRAVFIFAGVLTLAAIILFNNSVPNLRDDTEINQSQSSNYVDKIALLFKQFTWNPLLLGRCILGFITMAIFSGYWTSSSLFLVESPFHFSQMQIGFFSLLGVAGALVAYKGGDIISKSRYSLLQITLATFFLLLATLFIMFWGNKYLIIICLTAVLIEVSIQIIHVSNQTATYASENGEGSARLASAYMMSFALAGAFGTYFAPRAFQTSSWAGLCGLLGMLTIFATMICVFRQNKVENK